MLKISLLPLPHSLHRASCFPRTEGAAAAPHSPALHTLSSGLRNAFWSMLIQLPSLYWQFRPAFRDILEQMMFSWYFLKKQCYSLYLWDKVETKLEAHQRLIATMRLFCCVRVVGNWATQTGGIGSGDAPFSVKKYFYFPFLGETRTRIYCFYT